MNIFLRMMMSVAARRYANFLPRELEADWGASDNYTVGQVAASLGRRGEDGRYVAVAYAGLLAEADYQTVAASLPLALPYDVAREAFRRAGPWAGRFGPLSIGINRDASV